MFVREFVIFCIDCKFKISIVFILEEGFGVFFKVFLVFVFWDFNFMKIESWL